MVNLPVTPNTPVGPIANMPVGPNTPKSTMVDFRSLNQLGGMSNGAALTPLESGAAIQEYMKGNSIPEAIGGTR